MILKRTAGLLFFSYRTIRASTTIPWTTAGTTSSTTTTSAAFIRNMATATPSESSPPPMTNSAATNSKTEAQRARFWNRMANYYYRQPIKDEVAYKEKLEITRKYFTPQSHVLEFGCGTGGTALLHAPFVGQYHAIDYSSKMIDIAKQQQQQKEQKSTTTNEEGPSSSNDVTSTKNVKFECVGIDSFQAPPSSYDVVLGLSILHLLPNKDEILDKVHGLIKPGGYFISSTACLSDVPGIASKYIFPFLSSLGLIPKLNVFSKGELIESITSAGFVIEEEYHPNNDNKAAVFLVAKKVPK